MFSKLFFASILATVSAYTKPTGDAPVGNPISQPGLNSIVPAGQGFTITWNPTTKGTVTLVLLKGPSENAVPQYAIVEKTENDGSYVWTPSTDLEPTTGATGYGIQLIDDATGQYQYTTQFGISNSQYKKGGDKGSDKGGDKGGEKPQPPSYGGDDKPQPPSYGGDQPEPKPQPPSYGHHTSSTSETKPVAKPTAPVYPQTKSVSGTAVTSSAHPKPTGYWTASSNSTIAHPTGYKPTKTLATSAKTTAPSATYEGPAQQTGAASNNVVISFAGLVAAAGAAVFAL